MEGGEFLEGEGFISSWIFRCVGISVFFEVPGDTPHEQGVDEECISFYSRGGEGGMRVVQHVQH